MRLLFEGLLLQNGVFSATLLSAAVKAYYEEKDRCHGMPLPVSLLVLPLSYHRETAVTLLSKHRPSLLAKAVAAASGKARAGPAAGM